MKVKRSGFVYSLYRKNIVHLWILTALLLAAVGFLLIHHQGASYLMNYLFYRSEPNVEALTAYTERDMLDRDTVLSDIQKNGGEDALLRQRPSCFFCPNLYPGREPLSLFNSHRSRKTDGYGNLQQKNSL